MNIVIVGFGVAGATAAEVARGRNPQAHITVFSRERDLFYYRPRLPEVVAGAVSLEKVIAHPKEWYQERNIELRLGESVVELNPTARLVRGSLGSRLTYDRVLIATGAEANRPDLPGMDQAGIFTLRSLMDAWELKTYAKEKKEAVFIGGGLLGLELAYALTRLGLRVTVLERGSRVLPRQSTPGSAEVLQKKLAEQGVEFSLQSQTECFAGDRKLEKVVLADGRELPAQVAVLSTGVTPDLELAGRVPVKSDKGILVNDYLETSSPDIYAAGDCAQFKGAAGGLWTTSREQALIAGVNLAVEKPEDRQVYQPQPPANTLKVAGIDFLAAGNLDPDGTLPSAEARDAGRYRKVITDEAGRLVGFTAVGLTQGNKELNAALKAGKIIESSTLKALEDLEFDFSRL